MVVYFYAVRRSCDWLSSLLVSFGVEESKVEINERTVVSNDKRIVVAVEQKFTVIMHLRCLEKARVEVPTY